MRLIAALAVLMVLAIPARAEWTPEQMDAQIEKTNVEVGGVCSGTIISAKERIVLTAHHCIDDLLVEVDEKTIDPKTGEISVKRVQKRKPLTIKVHKIRGYEIVRTDEYLAKIVGDDASADITLLQVTDVDWVPEAKVKIADDYKLHRGQRVYVVGNPGIEFGNSIAEGIVSAPERTVDFGNGMVFKMFQHSAGTIGGNSGGSILNDNGELIGTVTGGVRGAPISFAIPISYTRALIKKSGFEKILKE